MASYQHELTPAPKDARERELWLQHAAGFILFQDSRAYAIERIDASIKGKARAAVIKGIDDALYGLMMIIDGASGRLESEADSVSLTMVVRHARSASSAKPKQLDLQDGDGMCMGIHGWREGDFGAYPPAVGCSSMPSSKVSSPSRPKRKGKSAKKSGQRGKQ